MSKMSGLELMNNFADSVNSFSSSQTEFIDGFSRQHRTLQQSMMKTMLSIIEHVASDEFKTDLRNEDTKKVAKMIVSGFKEMVIKDLMAQGYSREKSEEYANGDHYSMGKYLRMI